MDHRIDLFLIEYFFQSRPVADVLFIKLRPAARDLLNAVYHDLFRIIKIVRDHYIVSCLEQFHDCVAPDKTCSTCHQNCHNLSLRRPGSFPDSDLILILI